MAIHFACECGRPFSVKKRRAGKTVACPTCGRPVTVPKSDPVSRRQVRAEARRRRAYREPGDEVAAGYATGDLLSGSQRDGFAPDAAADDDIARGVSVDELLGQPAATPVPAPPGGARRPTRGDARSPAGPDRGGRPRFPAPVRGSGPDAGGGVAAAEITIPPKRRWWVWRVTVLLLVLVTLLVVYPDSISTVRTWLDRGTRVDAAAVHNDRGVELDAQNRLPEAIAEFEQAIHLAPGLFEAHYNLGNALDAAGRYEGAVAAFRTAIALHPYHAGASFGFGAALFKTGHPTDAVAQLQDTLRLDPQHAEAHLYLSYANDRLGRYAEAWASLQEARRLGAHFHASYARQLREKMDAAAKGQTHTAATPGPEG